jgi:hypothetical protein
MSILLQFLAAGGGLGDGSYTTVTPDANTQLLLPENPTRIVVYFHGAGGNEQEPLVPILDVITLEMIRNRWAVLSHYAHGDNWGNDVSLDDYTEAIAWAKGYTGVNRVDFFAQSMGGCCSLQMFAADPSVSHWVGIEPVCSLANLYSLWAAPSIKTAYGFSDDADYATVTAGHDPMLLDNAGFAGKKMWFNASVGDTGVPKAANATALFTKLNGTAQITYDQSPTGEHGDPSHFANVSGIINFLKS